MLPKPPTNSLQHSLRFLVRVLIKALFLFMAFNLAFALLQPLPILGRISAYNLLFPGRPRLPYGDNPGQAYNLSLFNLEAMFASHELSGKTKPPDEYRVILIGDSATWGFLLPNTDTLSAQLNRADLKHPDGRRIRVYNLGYPVMSLTKDLLMLSLALRYQPDLIIWPLTLESFPYDKQLYPPLLQNNPQAVQSLIETYRLDLNPEDPNFNKPSFWEQTLVGRRRALSDLIRLQLYGFLFAATGIDQEIPKTYTPRQENFEADASFHNLTPPNLDPADLALDVLETGIQMAGKTPVLVINEPIFVSQGRNSEFRYNFFYPRWAYDDYRKLLAQTSAKKGWNYRDFWDAVDNDQFTNSAVHLSTEGTTQIANKIGQAILDVAGETTP